MKTAIIFFENTKQIVFTPETEDEKRALKLFEANDNIELAIKSGTIYDKEASPFGVSFGECQGNYLRAYGSKDSIILILKPKANQTP